MRRSIGTLAALVLLTAVGGAKAEQIVNGGFESPDLSTLQYGNVARAPFPYLAPAPTDVSFVSGWTILANGNVDLVRFDPSAPSPEWPAFAGRQSLDLDGDTRGAIKQSFSTVAGHAYELTFEYANNPDGGVATVNATVNVAGTNPMLIANTITHRTSVVAAGVYTMNWSAYDNTFVADSTTTTLTFTGLDGGQFGIVLDAVSVTDITPATPTPAGPGDPAAPEPSSLALAAMGLVSLLGYRWRRTKTVV